MEAGKAKSLRKRDYAKVYGIFKAMSMALAEKVDVAGFIQQPSIPATTVSSDYNSGGDIDWTMQDVLVDPMFKWDEYLVDMVLDTDLNFPQPLFTPS
jgi:hypothetical protein